MEQEWAAYSFNYPLVTVYEIIYNYFAENHGKVDNITDNEKELIQNTKTSQSNN